MTTNQKIKSVRSSPNIFQQPQQNKRIPTKEECDIWKLNPEINPLTKKPIKFECPTYRWLQTHCCINSNQKIIQSAAERSKGHLQNKINGIEKDKINDIEKDKIDSASHYLWPIAPTKQKSQKKYKQNKSTPHNFKPTTFQHPSFQFNLKNIAQLKMPHFSPSATRGHSPNTQFIPQSPAPAPAPLPLTPQRSPHQSPKRRKPVLNPGRGAQARAPLAPVIKQPNTAQPQLTILPQWYNNRIEKGRRIKLGLKKITSKQWDMCMTGTKSQNFRKHFKNVKEIGKGTFGQIYKATLNNDDVVIKEAYLKPKDKRLLKTSSKETWDDVPKNTYPEEYSFMTFVNDILLKKQCPNFLYTYSMAMCDGCKVASLFGTGSIGSCYVSFMEVADGDLFDEKDLYPETQWSILFQILAAVYSIHHYYALFHRDIKTENIFLQKIQPGGYFQYVIGNDSFYIENTGYIAYLADFGVAEIFSPLHTKAKFYGERNAEVIESKNMIAGSYLYWDPITSKKLAAYDNVYASPREMSPGIIEWEDIENNKVIIGNINQFGVLDIKPDRPVDLNDNRKFPCLDFYFDIQDVIRMFMGGKQTKQPSWHDGIRHLDPDLYYILESEGYLPDLEDTFFIHGTVKYILAEEMLHQLYKYQPYLPKPKKNEILDIFYL